MTIQTFSWTPDLQGASGEHKFEVRTVKLGDGYEQRQAKGLKKKLQTWTASKTAKQETTAAIAAFFDAHGGVKAFYWTPPAAPRILVKVSEYSEQPLGAGVNKISWKFEEVMK